jgi:serine/threonine protein kinase
MIKLYQVLDTDLNIYLVMEYVEGGELFNLVNDQEGLKEEDARRLFR